MSKTTILEVYKDKKGLYQFRLISRDGKTIFISAKIEKKAAIMSQVNRLSEWVSKALLVDADKKADAASKTTGKQPISVTGKKVVEKAAASKVITKKPATKKVVGVNA